MNKITAEIALDHFTRSLEALYGAPIRAVWSTTPEHADDCGAIILLGCGGDIDTGGMIYEDLRRVSRLSISAHGAMEASPERPFFSFKDRFEEPAQSFFIHLDRQTLPHPSNKTHAELNAILWEQGFEVFDIEGRSLGKKE